MKMSKSDPTLFSGLNLRSLLENSDLLAGVANANRLQQGNLNGSNVANNGAAVLGNGSGNGNGNGSAVAKEDQKKEGGNDDVWGYLEAQAAFLGPSLWDNGDLKMEYMDLDEFLSENGIPANDAPASNQSNEPTSPTSARIGSSVSTGPVSTASASSDTQSNHSSGHYPTTGSIAAPSPQDTIHDDCESVQSSSSCSSGLEAMPTASLSSLLANAKATKAAMMEAQQTGRRKRSTTRPPLPSAFSDVDDEDSLIPGIDFDPRSRQFSEEELRPQPMSKKSKKQYVPDDLKDEKYWARRRKNNLAAKRSRDARRVKENQIAMRASFLEKEVNATLKAELDKVTKLYHAALKRLEQYEKPNKK